MLSFFIIFFLEDVLDFLECARHSEHGSESVMRCLGIWHFRISVHLCVILAGHGINVA